jgi:hypothetical protein
MGQGMIDGTYKQVARDRGGVIDPCTLRARRDLDDVWYGIHEASVKELPDALTAATPTYAATAHASCCGC